MRILSRALNQACSPNSSPPGNPASVMPSVNSSRRSPDAKRTRESSYCQRENAEHGPAAIEFLNFSVGADQIGGRCPALVYCNAPPAHPARHKRKSQTFPCRCWRKERSSPACTARQAKWTPRQRRARWPARWPSAKRQKCFCPPRRQCRCPAASRSAGSHRNSRRLLRAPVPMRRQWRTREAAGSPSGRSDC